MLIFIKTPSGKTIELVVSPAALVEKIEKQVQNSEDIPADAGWYLSFKGRRLERFRSLKTYDIVGGSTLCVEFEYKAPIKGALVSKRVIKEEFGQLPRADMLREAKAPTNGESVSGKAAKEEVRQVPKDSMQRQTSGSSSKGGSGKAAKQLPLGSVLPRIRRGPRCPGRTCIPRLLMKQFGEEEPREPKLYVLAFCAEADCVLSGWLRLEVDAPLHVEVATYEWPGHGVREREPLLSTLKDLGEDAFEAFREAMATGHFIVCGCSVGVLLMLYVCERAQRELGVSPRAAFALDRGPPHLPVFTEAGYKLLVSKPAEWLALWNPGIHRLHREGKIAEVAFQRWVMDMRVENDTRAVGWYRFPCRLTAIVALATAREFPPPAARHEDVDEEWAEKRAKCTRSGKGYSFEPEEYDLWSHWADDIRIYELSCEHESTQRDPAFQTLLWAEVSRVLQNV